jgi:protein farnesyltransferase subunit beta
MSVSPSLLLQQETEAEVAPYFIDLDQLKDNQLEDLRQTGLIGQNDTNVQLLRDKHIGYLSQVWRRSLKQGFVSLDSSRPWMLYWCLHGCDLLDGMPEIDDSERCRMVSTLEHCWSPLPITDHPVTRDHDSLYYSGTDTDQDETNALPAGGFGGGPGQIAHAATTYAAILSLCILSTDPEESESSKRAKSLLRNIRIPLYRWMISMQTESGGYRMHDDGEVDVRASYTILCCAKLLNLSTPYLCQDRVAQYIKSCQTWEGGIAGEPNCEAHGGYAFCGVAAMKILDKLETLDLPALTGWLARRQMSYEGGFSGRSNKLVDGCYSFWQGGATAITSAMYASSDATKDPWLEQQTDQSLDFPLLFDAPMLERYILLCAQGRSAVFCDFS